MKNKQHTIICVMAESSAGKDSLVNYVCKKNNYKQLISYTTRPRRVNEGDTHVFVNEEDYKKMLVAGDIVAYTNINGFHYWSTVDQLYHSDFYIIDPNGVESLKKLNLPNLHLVTIYIDVPFEVRLQRAINRGDDLEIYKSRCESEFVQFQNMKRYTIPDYTISNVEFSESCNALERIIEKEELKSNYDYHS